MTKRRYSYRIGIGFPLWLFLFMSIGVLYGQEPTILFQAQPESIEIGDTVLLSWEVPAGGDGSVFITHLGRVDAKGQVRVTPVDRISVYTLLSAAAPETSGEKIAQVSITVKGGRGDAFPADGDFKNARSYEIATPDLVRLLDGFHRVLQDTLGFEVQETYSRQTKTSTFVTKTSSLPAPANNADDGIRSRRLAYRVEIPESTPAPGKFSCQIRTLIQYRRYKESTWRTETSDTMHRECAENLAQAIRKAL